MDTNEALAHAQSDAQEIRNRRGQRWLAGEILVDGSAYSPSWRALPGGAQVWESATDHDDVEAVIALADAYEERLDELTDDLGWWEDGCFFANGGDLREPVGTWRNDA